MGNAEQVPMVTDEDIARVQGLLVKIGGPHVVWGSVEVLNVWLTEVRMESERRATRRVLLATWVLAIATVGLVVATIGLIIVTSRRG